jgi:hypothetical protein
VFESRRDETKDDEISICCMHIAEVLQTWRLATRHSRAMVIFGGMGSKFINLNMVFFQFKNELIYNCSLKFVGIVFFLK